MFKSAQQQNMFMCWLARIVGTFLIFLAFNMMFAPLSMALTVSVPLLHSSNAVSVLARLPLRAAGSRCAQLRMLWSGYPGLRRVCG